MEPGKRKPPKPQTRDAFKKKHQSLVFDENDLMHCKLCVKWKTKIASCDNFSLSFSGLVVKWLDSQSRGPVFKTTGWLQGRLSLSCFRDR